MRTVAIIPCYNEAKFIRDVVTRTRQYVDDVIVADDNSIDKTVEVAKEAGATVVQSSSRKGFSRNIISGITSAFRIYNPDIVVLLDGDGQHDPSDIPNLVKPIKDGLADIVIGNRVMNGRMPMYRHFGNSVLNLVCNIGASQQFNDSTCGFRAFNKKALESIKCTENCYGFAVEILIKARAKGFRIMGMPITCIYHTKFEDNSSMFPLTMGLSLVWVVLKLRIRLELLREQY